MDSIADQIKALASGANDATRKYILDSLCHLSYSLGIPTNTLQRICYSVSLNILGDSKDPLTVDYLVTKTDAAPGLLVGLVKETAKDTFTPNNITKSLCIPAIQAGVYHKRTDTKMPQNPRTPQKAFNTTDPAFIWIQTRPESQAYFNQFMEAHHSNKPRWFDVCPMAEKVQNFDLEQVFFVDVGGGIGHCTVEMAVVLPTIIPYEGVEGMEHNFFEPQPIEGAKFYFLSNIMHDYPDEKCVVVLKNIVSAMGLDSIILINNMVDLTMMTMLASLERTNEQWYVLMEKAGMRIRRIYESKEAVTESVMECVPV
ncbi:S-adenosyl-L-methionine-dependent methyltransferase [Aspergillus spectabilis]